MFGRYPSRILPFGDKNGILVVIFLVLSLGVGSLRSDQRERPNNPLHPSMVTLSQASQGPLGMEKMVYLNVDGKFFVDEPTVYPTGLDVYSRPVPESVKRQPDVGNVKIRLLDRETVNGACKEILGSPTTRRFREAVGALFSPIPHMGGIWKDIRGAYQVGSYCYGEDCHYDQKGYEISFSGVKERPWNGAALRFASRRAFKEKRSIIGVLCYFDRNRRERFISELETTRMSTSKIVFPTFNGGLRLFEGSEALGLYASSFPR